MSDRCFWSSLAYQGYAKQGSIETIRQINQPLVQHLLPDIVLWLDLPLDQALSRIFDAQGDRHETNGREFFERIVQAYELLIDDRRFSHKSYRIDASGTREEAAQKIIQQMEVLFP